MNGIRRLGISAALWLACVAATYVLPAHAAPTGASRAAASAPAAPAPALSERAKIDALIASVEQLRGAVFIRNGTEHDSAKAAAHLRRKLGAAGKRVRTADQFITYLATGSSLTGKPYRIRFADGHSVESAQYFREQLKRLESPRTAAAKG
jgi:hypothetical protein